MSQEMLYKLLSAGYKREQILTCPWGDPCPCESGGPKKPCGLAQSPWPICSLGFTHPPGFAPRGSKSDDEFAAPS